MEHTAEAQKIFDEIRQDLQSHEVVVYMKGTSEAPMCGFSGFVAQIFKKYGIQFKGINVLENPELRQAIKDFSQWPTIPQIYIKGEFIGGCDILRDLHASGELIEILKDNNIDFKQLESV